MKYTVSFLAVSVLLACAPKMYVRPGGDNMQFQHDLNDCTVKANQAGYGETSYSNWGAIGKRNNFIQQCLYGMGWTRQN